MPKLDGDVVAHEGLPRAPRSQRYRRRRDRHARPLARDPDDLRLQGGQGCLCREAAVDRRSSKGGRWSRRPGSTTRIVQVGTHRRSSRMYGAACRGGSLGAIGKVTVARAAFCEQHDAQRDRPCSRIRAAGRPRLGHVAGAAAGSTVPGDDHAVQVPLVAPLFVADRQLGRSLLRR